MATTTEVVEPLKNPVAAPRAKKAEAVTRSEPRTIRPPGSETRERALALCSCKRGAVRGEVDTNELDTTADTNFSKLRGEPFAR